MARIFMAKNTGDHKMTDLELRKAIIQELTLEVLAFVSDLQFESSITDDQIEYMINLSLDSGIETSLAVHLMLNPDIRILFERMKNAINTGETTVKGLQNIGLQWMTETENYKLAEKLQLN